MDISFINILTWILMFFVALLFALHLYISRRFGTLEALGIPCQKPWPFLGNTASELFSLLHEHDVKLYKKYGRIYGHYEGKHPTIRIGDPEILREVLVKQFPNFADRRHLESFTDKFLMRFISLMRGEEWKQTRNILTPAFTSGKLRQMTPLIEKCSTHLVKLIEKKSETGESFEAKRVFFTYMTDVIASCAFGLDMNVQVNDGEKFVKYAKQFVAGQSLILFTIIMNMPVFMMRWVFFPLLKQFTQGLQFFKKISSDVIKIRLTNNEVIKQLHKESRILFSARSSLAVVCEPPDILDANGKGEDETSKTKQSSETHNDSISDTNGYNKPTPKKILTVDDVTANALLFLFAGFETTSTTLSFIAYALATNQECQDKLLEEIDTVLQKNEGKLNYDVVAQMQYMEMVIMETLRIYPPLVRIDRQCLVTTKINDVVIPKDVVVVIPVYAMHHDEEFYPEPHKFDPERFSPENKDQRNQYTFFGFGIGPRNCIGMRFALMEMKLTLTYILKNHRFICGPKTQIPLKFVKGRAALMAEDGVQLYVEKRSTTT